MTLVFADRRHEHFVHQLGYTEDEASIEGARGYGHNAAHELIMEGAHLDVCLACCTSASTAFVSHLEKLVAPRPQEHK